MKKIWKKISGVMLLACLCVAQFSPFSQVKAEGDGYVTKDGIVDFGTHGDDGIQGKTEELAELG